MPAPTPADARLDKRIARRFAALEGDGRPGLIPYLTVGYPSVAESLELAVELSRVGADVIELGVPFSDPMADGPTIQRSSQAALDAGTTLDDVFDVVARLRSVSDVPIVLFSYLNPILSRGVDHFLSAAVEAGADGLLATDLPLGSDPHLEEVLEGSVLDLIRLVAPTSPGPRIGEIAARAQGFLYYIARTGVTGVSQELRSGLAEEVQVVRDASPVPVAVGFGISTPEQAATVGAIADAAVVGSALVDRLGTGGVEAAVELAKALRAALDGCRRGGVGIS